MRFGERMGFIEPVTVFQYDSMDNDLRMDIYNWLHYFFEQEWGSFVYGGFDPGYGHQIGQAVWVDFAREDAADYSEYYSDFNRFLKNFVLHEDPHRVYELVEYLYPLAVNHLSYETLNGLLERNRSAFRFEPNLGEFVAVTDETEMLSLQETLQLGNKYSSASNHIAKALKLLSKQPEPDLANAVKEAISSVEAAAKIVSGKEKATLGDAIKEISAQGQLHKALNDAWLKMYGYTNDAGGIRHASISAGDALDFPTAKYMVVTCSAFVNLLCALPPKPKEE